LLLTLTTTARPATDLGYLLHKNPGRVQSFELSFGKAHVFYPEASHDRCNMALLLDVDPVGLVRGRRAPPAKVPWTSTSTTGPTWPRPSSRWPSPGRLESSPAVTPVSLAGGPLQRRWAAARGRGWSGAGDGGSSEGAV